MTIIDCNLRYNMSQVAYDILKLKKGKTPQSVSKREKNAAKRLL
jgi:hypothetical protein